MAADLNRPNAELLLRLLVLEIRLDRAGQLDGQRIAVAILGVAGGDADPAFADAIFLDIGLLDALEADADIAPQRFGVEIRAARIVAQAVGRGVGFGVCHAAFSHGATAMTTVAGAVLSVTPHGE